MPNSKKLLITAFGPFPGMPVNPTKDLVRCLAQTGIGPVARCEHLRVSYGDCRDWARRLDLSGLSAIVHLGVAQGADTLRLETTAWNSVTPNTPDVDGRTWDHAKIINTAPDQRTTTVDCRTLWRQLPAELRSGVVVSDDAGRYLCNFIYYHTLHAVQMRAAPVTVIFIHVPGPGTDRGRDGCRQVRILSHVIGNLL